MGFAKMHKPAADGMATISVMRRESMEMRLISRFSFFAIAPESIGSTMVEMGTMTAFGRSKYLRAVPSQPFIAMAEFASTPAAPCKRYIITEESTMSSALKNAEPMMTGTAKVRIDFKISPTLETFGSKGE